MNKTKKKYIWNFPNHFSTKYFFFSFCTHSYTKLNSKYTLSYSKAHIFQLNQLIFFQIPLT